MPASKDDGSQLHNRLALLRAERGLSRQDLARAMDIHYQTVGYLERGEYNPSLDLALRLARFFDLPVEALFSLDPFAPLSLQVYGRSGLKGERP
jgi:DNA-binding XRE family transcriptional regulator